MPVRRCCPTGERSRPAGGIIGRDRVGRMPPGGAFVSSVPANFLGPPPAARAGGVKTSKARSAAVRLTRPRSPTRTSASSSASTAAWPSSGKKRARPGVPKPPPPVEAGRPAAGLAEVGAGHGELGPVALRVAASSRTRSRRAVPAGPPAVASSPKVSAPAPPRGMPPPPGPTEPSFPFPPSRKSSRPRCRRDRRPRQRRSRKPCHPPARPSRGVLSCRTAVSTPAGPRGGPGAAAVGAGVAERVIAQPSALAREPPPPRVARGPRSREPLPPGSGAAGWTWRIPRLVRADRRRADRNSTEARSRSDPARTPAVPVVAARSGWCRGAGGPRGSRPSGLPARRGSPRRARSGSSRARPGRARSAAAARLMRMSMLRSPGASARLWASPASRSRESTWRGCAGEDRQQVVLHRGQRHLGPGLVEHQARVEVERAAAEAAPAARGRGGRLGARRGGARSAPGPAARAARPAWPRSRPRRRPGPRAGCARSPAAVSIRMPTRLPAARSRRAIAKPPSPGMLTSRTRRSAGRLGQPPVQLGPVRRPGAPRSRAGEVVLQHAAELRLVVDDHDRGSGSGGPASRVSDVPDASAPEASRLVGRVTSSRRTSRRSAARSSGFSRTGRPAARTASPVCAPEHVAGDQDQPPGQPGCAARRAATSAGPSRSGILRSLTTRSIPPRARRASAAPAARGRLDLEPVLPQRRRHQLGDLRARRRRPGRGRARPGATAAALDGAAARARRRRQARGGAACRAPGVGRRPRSGRRARRRCRGRPRGRCRCPRPAAWW